VSASAAVLIFGRPWHQPTNKQINAMKILLRLFARIGDFSDVQPILALFLGGAVLAVFLAAILPRKSPSAEAPAPGLLGKLYVQCGLWLWAIFLVTSLLGGLSVLRSCLHQTVASFQRSHGRITTANYNAVQTIWGPEQQQGELTLNLFWEEEVTNRFEPEDVTKPAILRKKIVRHDVTSNPFISARHDVTLKQNPRKKGSALYGGYETQCAFSWRLKNPEDRPLTGDLRFPLPANSAMYDGLYATLNGEDILPQMHLKDAGLELERDLKPGDVLDLKIGFKSRGMSFWYFQVNEPREIRDFTLTLNLPDLPKARLNYPEGCMTPGEIQPAANGPGSVLTYRLDHAITTKGMGISLPTLPQPGATTSAVLGETEQGWLLIFALLVLGLTLAGVNHAVVVSLLFGAAIALGYGLLGDFSDLLFGFWGTAAFILLPVFLLLASLLRKAMPGATGRLMSLQMLLYGILLPCLAGLDDRRASLYQNICASVFLAFIAWQLVRQWSANEPAAALNPVPAVAN
jgi:hypothetical protein